MAIVESTPHAVHPTTPTVPGAAGVSLDPRLGPVLLDGAMGTALRAAGLPEGVPPERWLSERPQAIRAVHAAHAGAGASVLLTCTFNAASPRLGSLPGGPAGCCARAVALARMAAPQARVAGALGPLALARPGGPAPAAQRLRRPFERPLAALADAGADLLWLESQYDGREAEAALAAAVAVGLPVVVTFTLEARGGRLVAPDGTPGEALLARAAGFAGSGRHDGRVVAVGVNCVAAGAPLAALAAWARTTLPLPFVAKPSPGLPGAVASPRAFAEALAPAVAAGARLVGGCCGAGAAHLAALAGLLQAGVARG
jgi:5-methyltetrahydrofolate--homocysteine methyltransferase